MSNLLPINPRPSDAAGVDLPQLNRRGALNFDQVAIATGFLGRQYVTAPGRITGVRMFRRTAGDTGGTTTVDVLVNGTSILDSTQDFAQASGDGLSATPALDTSHANYVADGGGIEVGAGDYVEVQVTAAETASAAGLDVQVDTLNG